MNTKNDDKNAIKNLTFKYTKFCNIDEKVDKILSENKKLFNKLNKKEFNLEKISLKNKKGNSIYFLKKRHKYDENTNNSDIFSNKSISDVKKINDKKPHETRIKKEEFIENIDHNYLQKKHIGLDNKEQYNKKYPNIKTTDDLVKTKEFDKIVSEIEKEIDKIHLEMKNDVKKIVLKKLMENSELDKSHEKEDIEKKSSELDKKFPLFLKHEPLRNEEKEEIDRVLPATDNLAERKKHDIQKITPTKITDKKEKTTEKKDTGRFKIKRHFFRTKKTSEVKPTNLQPKSPEIEKITIKPTFSEKKITFIDELDKEKINPIDKELIKWEEKEKTDKKPVTVETETTVKKIIEEPYLKNRPSITSSSKKSDKKFRFFFKHKALKNEKKEEPDRVLLATDNLAKTQKLETEKLKPIKITDKKEKTTEKKDTGKFKIKRHFFRTKKAIEVKPSSPHQKSPEIENATTKPIFHVEKIVLGDELDKEDADLVDKKIIESKEKTDEKTMLGETKAKKLLKGHLKNKETVPSLNEEPVKKSDTNLVLNISTNDKELGQEHIFFDEEDSPHHSWSPHIIEKEKNKGSLTTISQGEIGLDQLGKLTEIELPKNFLSTASVNLSELGFSKNEWEELDFYALHEPFAYVEILRQRESLDKCYFLVEMALTEEEENLLAFINDTLINLSIDAEEMENKGEDEYLIEKLDQIIDEYNVRINDESKKKLYYFIGKSSLGLGKINPLMKDSNIEDISCDGSGVPIFLYHRKYGSLKSNIKFEDEDELSSFIFKLAQKCGKHISIAEPMLDATMPDGSRIQMTLSDEITAKGSTFTIRKFRSDPFSPTDLIEFNTMSSEMIAYMWMAVENGINTLFAGGTASGKTTTLNAVMLFIPRESKIVSIEETREINLPHPNWIPGVARSGFGEVVADKAVGEIDTYDLMKAALRQRPEYIIVGEIRGKEAYVLFQAMATGHATYSTAHADSAQSLIHRLEGKPINIPRIMLQSLDLVCIHIITRVKNMRARRCKQIIEIIDIDPTTKEILTNDVFHWDPVEDKFIYSGKSYILERLRTEKDLTREEMSQEIDNRRRIVEWMNENNIRGFKDVANIVSKYAEAPEELLKKLGKDNN